MSSMPQPESRPLRLVQAAPGLSGPAHATAAMHPPFSIFIHVPKTGGTALKQAYIKALGPQLLWYHPVALRDDTSGVRHIQDLSALPAAQMVRDHRLLGGHFNYTEIPPELAAMRPVYLGVIREPIARAKSYYGYLRTNTRHPMHEAIRPCTLNQALDLPGFVAMLRGGQIRRLCGKPTLKDLRALMATQPFLIGKQEFMPTFQAGLRKHLGIELQMRKGVNANPTGIEDELRAQPGYDTAIERLAQLCLAETRMFESFGKVLVSRPLRLMTLAREAAHDANQLLASTQPMPLHDDEAGHLGRDAHGWR
jgi:hypothetical protein